MGFVYRVWYVFLKISCWVRLKCSSSGCALFNNPTPKLVVGWGKSAPQVLFSTALPRCFSIGFSFFSRNLVVGWGKSVPQVSVLFSTVLSHGFCIGFRMFFCSQIWLLGEVKVLLKRVRSFQQPYPVGGFIGFILRTFFLEDWLLGGVNVLFRWSFQQSYPVGSL